MSLGPGSRLGPYEVVAPLGAGGMGEVYRARDTRLKREVALKILPSSFAADPDRLARFEREAQALAALNHPNIASIHGIEEARSADGAHTRALVLELVEGETLAERIARGPGPVAVDEALVIARQIADALEAAHEQGIIHRDLKPANVKVTPDHVVKVLDFGLAKLEDDGAGRIVPSGSAGSPGGGSSASIAPTMTSPAMLTGAGILLGTAAYMAPEQARGKAIDKRADIWAFGVVLYEMLTGARGFEGETITETAGAVIHKEPDWSRLPKDTPPLVRAVLQRCLQKDPKQRARDIGDVRLALAGAFTPDTSGSLPAEAGSHMPKTGSHKWLPPLGGRWQVGVALVAGLLVGAGAWMFTRSEAPSRSPLRFEVPPPAPNTGAPFAMVSPDGRSFAFFALDGEAPRLWVHSFDSGASRVLAHAGNVGGLGPYWSPDSRSLLFGADRKLKKVAVSGGPVETLCDLATGNFLGAAWSRNDVILFADGSKGIMQVPASGGSPVQVTAVDRKRGESNHATPSFLPDGRHFLYNRLSGAENRGVYIGALDTKPEAQELTRLVATEQTHAYAPSDGSGTGHLLFMREGLLMAQAFNEGRRVLTGEAVPVAEQVWVLQGVLAAFSVSTNGTLVYRRGSPGGSPVWVDRSGQELGTIGTSNLQDPRNPRFSPDGRRLALVVAGDVWSYDLEGRPPVKLTFEGGRFSPMWTRDGARLVYEGSGSLWEIPADGSGGTPKKVAPPGHYHPHASSANGEIIALRITEPGNIMDLVQFAAQETAEPKAIAATPASEGFTASLSPDGRWLAYQADPTGRMEIWVRPYPGPGSAIRVSPNGGMEPLWAKNGRELYYLEFPKMMAVAIDTAGGFNFKPPTMLFESRYVHSEQPPSYDVAADGRFILIKSATSPNEPTKVILNWLELLRGRGTN